MMKEKIFENINDELKGVFCGYVNVHTNIREDGNMYIVDVTIEDELDYDFEVEFDGTVEGFVKALKRACECFNPGECARNNIEKYDIWSISDLQWYIDKAEELESVCDRLSEDLDEYLLEQEEDA